MPKFYTNETRTTIKSVLCKTRRPQKGQALVLFAFSAVVLIAIAGLAIDEVTAFIQMNSAQSAADAAAIAAVPYAAFPTAATPAPDGSNAVGAADIAAAQNGFTDTSKISVSATMQPIPKVTVSIAVNLSFTLMALVGVNAIGTSVTATANMLPPINSDNTQSSVGLPGSGEYIFLTGQNDLKEFGDPYSTLCEDGWSDASNTTYADAPNYIYTTRLGTSTNAPQYPTGPQCSPASPGNPDAVPGGFGGLLTANSSVPNGESYLVMIPPGAKNIVLWIYNPQFVYQNGTNTGSYYDSYENIFSPPYFDNIQFYPNIAYSLYSVPEWYHRSADTLVSAIWPNNYAPQSAPNVYLPAGSWKYLPSLDMTSADLTLHGCSGALIPQSGSYYNPPITAGLGCVPTPSDIMNWVAMPYTFSNSTSAPLYYRFTADISGGYGLHAYALAICADGASPPCLSEGATVGAWNTQTIYLNGSQTNYPIFTIPAAYKGQQVTVRIFNPGVAESDENINLGVTGPANAGTIIYPSYLRTTSGSGGTTIETAIAGDNLYHAKWITVTIQLAPNYNGGQWYITYSIFGAATLTPMLPLTVAVSSPGNLVQLTS